MDNLFLGKWLQQLSLGHGTHKKYKSTLDLLPVAGGRRVGRGNKFIKLVLINSLSLSLFKPKTSDTIGELRSNE